MVWSVRDGNEGAHLEVSQENEAVEEAEEERAASIVPGRRASRVEEHSRHDESHHTSSHAVETSVRAEVVPHLRATTTDLRRL